MSEATESDNPINDAATRRCGPSAPRAQGTSADASASEPVATEPAATVSIRPPSPMIAGERVGERIGEYVLVEEIGRGGMGVVYKAWQPALKRSVALKMLRQASHASVEDFERFRVEAEAVARLQHPNLVSIHQVDLAGAQPFYVMEYLGGGSLAQRLGGLRMAPRAAARMILTLANAVDYAHRQGIVHRDLKPGNILLADAETPLDSVVAKIGDFGIAKRLYEDTKLTQTGQILGTPQYMAPEQAAGQQAVGPAADIYSLGAILYELLTGRPPFDDGSVAGTLQRVLNEDPESPRALDGSVPRDLETICLTCLEKNPGKRYATAGQLADDLGRFLEHKPIQARAATSWENLVKWARRHPVAATSLLATTALVLLTIVGLAVFLRQAMRQATMEAELVKTKEQSLFEVRTLLADALLERGIALAEKNDVRRGMHWMFRSLEIAEGIEDRVAAARPLAQAARYNLSHWAQYASPPAVPLPHRDWAWAMGFSSDGRYALTGSADRHVRVWDAFTGRPVGSALAHADRVWAVHWHARGDLLVSGSGEWTHGEVRVFKADGAGGFTALGAPVALPGRCMAFVADPGSDDLLARYERVDPETKARTVGMAWLKLDAQGVSRRDWSLGEGTALVVRWPGGDRWFRADAEGRVTSVDPKTGVEGDEVWQLPHAALQLAVSGDGRHLLAGTFDAESQQSRLHLWDRERDIKRMEILKARGRVRDLQFAPDHRTFAWSVAHKDAERFECTVQAAAIPENHRADMPIVERAGPLSHPQPVWSLAFASEDVLLTGCQDGFARLWNIVSGALVIGPEKHEGNVVQVAVSPDRRRVLTASAGGNQFAQARLWELPSRSRLEPVDHDAPFHTMMWAQDGRHFYVRDNQKIHRYDLQTRRMDRDFPGSYRQDFCHPYLAFHLKKDGTLRIHDLESDRTLLDLTDIQVRFHEFHPQLLGDHLLVHSRADGEIRLYRMGEGTGPSRRVTASLPNCWYVDSARRRFVTCSASPTAPTTRSEVMLWSAELEVLRRWTFEIAPNNCRLCIVGEVLCVLTENEIRLFSLDTGVALRSPLIADGRIDHFTKHPREEILVTATANGTTCFWHIPSGKTVGRNIVSGSAPSEGRFAPQGDRYFVAHQNRRNFLFQHDGPKTGELPEVQRWVELLTGLKMDERERVELIAPEERQQ